MLYARHFFTLGAIVLCSTLVAYPSTAQDVPPIVPPAGTDLIQPPDPCDTGPCIKPAPPGPPPPMDPSLQGPPTYSSNSVPPAAPSADDVLSTADHGKTAYEALAPIGNAAAKSLPNSNPLKIINFPEIPGAVGIGLNAVQLGVKCYQGAQKDGVNGCAAEAGKEAILTAAQTAGTAVGTCLAAGTGPLAPAIGAATGLCARAAAEYALDHPAVLKPLVHAGDCDPYGNCVPNTDLDASPTPAPAADPTRQDLESQFDQTSAQNDAAALAAAQQADAANSSPPASSDGDFLNGLLQGLDAAALLTQSAHPQSVAPPQRSTAATAPSTPTIPPGWVPCSCPSQHAGMGQYFGGTLYHPQGPQCR